MDVLQTRPAGRAPDRIAQVFAGVHFYPVASFCICTPATTPFTSQCSGEHQHPSYLFKISLSNQHCMPSDDQTPPQTRAELYAISPFMRHGGSHHGGDEDSAEPQYERFYAIFIDSDWFEQRLAEYGLDAQTLPGIKTDVPPALLSSISSYISEYQNHFPGRRDLLSGLALQITHTLIRQLFRIRPAKGKMVPGRRTAAALEFLRRNYSHSVTVEQMAEQVHLSPAHFSRLFRQETGLSPARYLNELRLSEARRQLMYSSQPVTTIALNCGFNSLQHFSAAFSGHYHISPNAFRRAFRL